MCRYWTNTVQILETQIFSLKQVQDNRLDQNLTQYMVFPDLNKFTTPYLEMNCTKQREDWVDLRK